MLGYTKTGGLGTATSLLAVALGRMGHRVELLYLGETQATGLGNEWARLYGSAGVEVRLLGRENKPIDPPYFARMREVERALAANPADVVIVQDLAAPAYTALRSRQLGLKFNDTLFVIYCHGTRQWITNMARKVRVLPGALAISILEQASVELADVAVCPSRYVLDWMAGHGWRLPSTLRVIPYFTRSSATGEPRPVAAKVNGGIERIAFFGRLEERKGLKPFAAGLDLVDPGLLRKIELEFIGSETPAWPPERVRNLLSERTRHALRGISFQTDLDQSDALTRLSRPRTLAVMPSLGETFSNAVYECLDRGIPFIASNAGAPAELVAPEDRSRVLFEPTPEGVAKALQDALAASHGVRPARSAFDGELANDGWRDLVAIEPTRRTRTQEKPKVDVVVIEEEVKKEPSPCTSALARQTYGNFNTRIATSRQDAVAASSAEWILFLERSDVPDEDFLATLVAAQAASDADVVTCGIRFRGQDGERLFLGDPGGLGLLANHYGTAGLIRRSLLADQRSDWPVDHDPDWPLLARLAARGAQIVSIPRALLVRDAHPGDIRQHPSDALLVVQEFERRLPREVRSLARLAGGLAAARAPSAAASRGTAAKRLLQMLLGR
jgi:glycosyltransferase involved in cell wall biosynthesis